MKITVICLSWNHLTYVNCFLSKDCGLGNSPNGSQDYSQAEWSNSVLLVHRVNWKYIQVLCTIRLLWWWGRAVGWMLLPWRRRYSCMARGFVRRSGFQRGRTEGVFWSRSSLPLRS